MATNSYGFAPQSSYGMQPSAGFQLPQYGLAPPGAGMPFDGQGVNLNANQLYAVPDFGDPLANMNVPAVPGAGQFPSWMPEWMAGAIGTKEQPGWGGFALGAANSAASMFMGMKQYGLAKDTLNENKRQFQLNYDAQKQTTNTALEDRQRARVASNAGAYQSVGEYMNTNGVK